MVIFRSASGVGRLRFGEFMSLLIGGGSALMEV
jgi:hypothetical protein